MDGRGFVGTSALKRERKWCYEREYHGNVTEPAIWVGRRE